MANCSVPDPRPRRAALCCLALLLGAGVGAFLPLAGSAAEFRHIRPILMAPAGGGAVQGAATALQPVDRELIERAVRDIAQAWNGGDLQRYLAEDFYDRERLGDAIDRIVPRDARLRVLSVQGVQTLSQELQQGSGGQRERVSLVSVTVRTQVEFNGEQGFVRLPGTNELILRVREPLP